MTIKAGSYVRVPKGTPCYETKNYDFKNPEPSSRDQIVKVKEICDLKDHGFLDFVSPNQQEMFYSEVRALSRANPFAFNGSPAIDRKYIEIAKQNVPNGDLRAIEWSGKRTLIGYVEPAEAPKRKAPVARKPNKRQQMVKGSTWTLNADAAFTQKVDNPQWNAAIQQFWRNCRANMQTGTENDLRKALKKAGIPEFDEPVFVRFAKDTLIKVTGKFTTYSPVLRNYAKGNIWVPVEVAGKRYDLPYSQFEPLVDVGEIPVVYQYVLRDRVTGLFFQAFASNYGVRDANMNWISDRTTGGATAFTDNFMKAKRMDDMARVKQFVLNFSGYYEGLTRTEEGRPEWAEMGKVMDLPASWEAVKFDKLARTEVEAIDLQAWNTRTWKLRALTVAFGSPVRTLFNDIEKRGELDKYQGMVVLRAPIEKWYGERTQYSEELKPADIAEFEQIAETMGMGRKDFRRAKDSYSIAMTMPTANSALHAKMSYGGSSPLIALDLREMRELVD